MKNISNKTIRLAMMDAGITNWQLYQALGLSESTFYRLMRSELDEDTTAKWLIVIKEVSERDE